jgi:copper chaperone
VGTMRTAIGTILVVLGVVGAAAEQPQKVAVCILKVTGMTCGGCAAAVKSAAKKVDGVKEAVVSYDKGVAEVTYDPAKTTPQAIAQAVTERSGFKAEVQTPKRK